jgi:predicted phage tail protein
MLTVRLHGHLEESYGSEFKFEARTVREVIDALQANFNDFTEEFIKDERAYTIVVDAEAQELSGCVLPLKSDSTIDIVPAIVGAGGIFKALALIVVGAVLVWTGVGLAAALGAMGGAAAGAVTVGVLGASFTVGAGTALAIFGGIAAIGAGLLLSGVASLLAGPDGPDGAGEKASSLSRTDNVVGQGLPVPIGYGRLMIGSVVLSASFVSSLSKICPAYTYKTGGVWVDKQLSFGQQQDVEAIQQNATEDGYTLTLNYDGGYAGEEWTGVVDYWQKSAAGAGFYTVVPSVNVSGVTIPVTKFVPGTSTTALDDSGVNKRV